MKSHFKTDFLWWVLKWINYSLVLIIQVNLHLYQSVKNLSSQTICFVYFKKGDDKSIIFGVINCENEVDCIEALFVSIISVGFLVLILIFLLIIFVCVNSIKNRQFKSKSRQSSKQLTSSEERRNSPAKNYTTRSSSISLASEDDDESDENPYSISPRELVR